MDKIGSWALVVLMSAVLWCGCQPKSAPEPLPEPNLSEVDDGAVTKERVVEEFLHAWNGYKKYAWGHDALKPLSKSGHDWYEHSLLMTPVDAFDTMIIMGLDQEAKAARDLIFERLSFNRDMEVQHFEVSIRILGGLISAYQLDGDTRFLELAVDLADRMLPVFDSPTGMPYRFVNLKTGKTSGRISNPAEIGTYLLEYGALSKLTGDDVYYEKAKRAAVALYDRRSERGLVGSLIDVKTGVWLVRESHVGGGIDSYYEYLLKGWVLFEDEELKKMWETHIKAVNTYVADESTGDLWYGHVNMNSGKRTLTTFGALYAFSPGALALGGDLERAAMLEESCYKMWVLHGIEPELIDYRKMKVVYGPYQLRPEIVESAYYLFHYTSDEKYRRMGSVFFNGIVKHCRVDSGYAALADVRTGRKADSMESYFLAETMKYFYLLFAPPHEFDFEKVVFNTEAHPIFKTW
jgi:mannosidase alpha-like ER degradation enhancer 2